MERERSRFKIEPRILILFLILGIPPLIVGHLILVNGAEERFRQVVGTYFGQKADSLQMQLLNYVESVSVQLGNLTQVPEIQAVVRKSYTRESSDEAFAQRIQSIEEDWAAMTVENSDLLAGVLQNQASDFLRDYNLTVVTYREILVTDRFGRLVAASSKVSDYFQADENWWRVAYMDGQGQRYVSDIVYDESVRAHGLEMAEPIRDSSGQVLGIVKVVLDTEPLFSPLRGLEFGQETVAILLRGDGSVVTDFGEGEPYPFMDMILSNMRLNRRAIEVPEENPEAFVGLPQFGLGERMPELDWYVVVQAPYEEVFVPFSNLRDWFMYIVIFSVILIIGLSILFTWMLSKPIIETDPHLERA